jgi:hypothetical protein
MNARSGAATTPTSAAQALAETSRPQAADLPRPCSRNLQPCQILAQPANALTMVFAIPVNVQYAVIVWRDMMDRILFILLVAVLLSTTLAVSGCTTQSGTGAIVNSDQASNAMVNISNGVQDVASALNDIDHALG